jgi:beta-N-acetylhexosaminidase
MNAITERYTLKESLRLAVEAGADMLLLSGNSPGAIFDPDMPRKAHRALVALVKNGSISRQRLSESWDRIIRLKSARRALFPS